eukprot:COSAG04_NODE_933_length_9342_cov_2.591042_3_plen_59_part_00
MLLALGPLLADAHGGLTFPVPRNNHNAVDPRNWVSACPTDPISVWDAPGDGYPTSVRC